MNTSGFYRNFKTLADPKPRCPICGDYEGFNIKPKKKLTGDWTRLCLMCKYKGNLDTFKYEEEE